MPSLLFISLFVSVFIQCASAASSNHSGTNFVARITKDLLEGQTALNRSVFVLFYSKRCSKCENQRRQLINLPSKLKETGLDNIVLGETDCCKEFDLCKSSDRATKCLPDDIIQENEIWKLVEPTDVCIKESTAKESHFRAKTVDECARKCSEATDLFAFGTNEFGGQGCHYGLCKCDCIYKKDDSDHNCQDLDKQSYWFFQMKRGVNFGREAPACKCDFRGVFEDKGKYKKYKWCWLHESPCKALDGTIIYNSSRCEKWDTGAKLIDCNSFPVRFGFGIQGSGICSEGEIIKDKTLCKDACRELNLLQKEILGNFNCYKDLAGNCYQNRHHGAGASMICEISKNGAAFNQTKYMTSNKTVADCNEKGLYGDWGCFEASNQKDCSQKGWKGSCCVWNGVACISKPAFEYNMVIKKQKKTCDKTLGTNRIRSVGWVSKKECEDACNANGECIFFSLTTEKSYCAIFKTCTESKRVTSVLVSVYQKGDEICTPYSITACIKASTQLGLQIGGNGKQFLGDNEIKGCHAYNSSAYYGIEKTDKNKHRTMLAKPFYRPIGYDCDFDPCNPNPCVNRGVCIPSAEGKGFTCKCKKNCSGEYCEDCPPALVNFETGFPILWFSWNGGQSSMEYKGPKDIDSLMFFMNDKMGNGELSRKTPKELIMEAGCRAPDWKDENFEKYEWKADGKLLAKGACISARTQAHLVPDPGKTKVRCRFDHERVRKVDSRGQTISTDLTLTMKWWDPNIKQKASKIQSRKGQIFLSQTSITKIWTPDLRIENLTSFKFKEEWIELVTSKILLADESNQLNQQKNPEPNVEISYEIKAKTYCIFDHSKYPFDQQNCSLALGSKSAGAIFVLEDYYGTNDGNSTYIASSFHVSSNFFDENRHGFGNNTIGIRFIMTHATIPYLVKYYIPCNAIVIISMMSFTIPLTAIPGRIGLLVTQFLTLTNLFIYEMSESPTVSGVNGLGIYLLCSLGLVFFALIEFAMIITLKRKKENEKESPKKNKKHKKSI